MILESIYQIFGVQVHEYDSEPGNNRVHQLVDPDNDLNRKVPSNFISKLKLLLERKVFLNFRLNVPVEEPITIIDIPRDDFKD